MMITNREDTLSDALRIKKLYSKLIPIILNALMIQSINWAMNQLFLLFNNRKEQMKNVKGQTLKLCSFETVQY